MSHPIPSASRGRTPAGPIPEGMITWLIAAVMLVALCMVIGTRLRRE